MPITYTVGDATFPNGDGMKIIPHVCNTVRRWGAGFVVALSKRWPEPEHTYLTYNKPLMLGLVQLVQVEPDIIVANMVAQRALRSPYNPVPLDYDALERCLEQVAQFALVKKATINCGRLGCGLAGGEWGKVERRLENAFCKKGIDVIVYDLPKGGLNNV